jgi:UDP-3-O-[3-hydroxymyristoyl] glucosamine N-acyltransferase
VFIGHNATLNGRVAVGDDVWIGAGVNISNEVRIGAGSRVALGSTVMTDVVENARLSGLPALEQQLIFRHAAIIRRDRNRPAPGSPG